MRLATIGAMTCRTFSIKALTKSGSNQGHFANNNEQNKFKGVFYAEKPLFSPTIQIEGIFIKNILTFEKNLMVL